MPRVIRFANPLCVILLAATGLISGCGSSDSVTPSAGTIALSLSSSASSQVPGSTFQLSGTLTRSGGFTGDVAVTVEGLPSGVTAVLTSQPTAGSTSATATVTVASTTAPGQYSLTFRAKASGLTDATAPYTLTVMVAGSYTVTTPLASLSVVQGATVTTYAKTARVGYVGTINYAVTGAPAGLAATVAPTAVPDSELVTITAGAALAAGSYPIVVHGGSGAFDQTATINVTVVAKAAVRLDYSQCAAPSQPVWLAYQDGSGAWTAVTGTANVYSFGVASGTAALAAVTQNAAHTSYSTTVQYLSRAELAAMTSICSTAAAIGKTVLGTTANVNSASNGSISMGGSNAGVSSVVTSYQLTYVASGLQDLFAYDRTAYFTLLAGDHIIVRRDQNIAAGGSEPLIDFLSAEAVNPLTANLTISSTSNAGVFQTTNILTGAGCTVNQLNQGTNSQLSPVELFGIPASLQRSTDYYNVMLEQFSGGLDDRTMQASFHALTDRSVTMGAAVSPTVTAITGGAYMRGQAVLTLASDYQTASFYYYDNIGVHEEAITESAGFLSGNTAVTMLMPDLTAAGYSATWGPLPAATIVGWSVTASSTPPATMCAEGATIRTASSTFGGA